MAVRPVQAATALILGVVPLALLALSAGLARGYPAPASAPTGPAIRWGYYVTYDSASTQSLRSGADVLSHVAPYFYQMDARGQIVTDENAEALRLARAAGMRVVPMLKNIPQYDAFSPFLREPNQRGPLLDRIVNLVQQKGYDGINIDFEGINPDDRPHLTAFMAELQQRFAGTGKLVTMAIPAKPRDLTTGWSGAYDYRALGQYVDLVLIMAYDFHFRGGEAGAVAPLTWVERSAAFAAAEIGAGKVVLGIPLYGYDWNLSTRAPADYRKSSEVEALRAQYSGTPGYDDTEQSPWLRYRKDDQDHEVWYEDARSLRAKLRVVQSLGLAGFGLWRLGHEDATVWQTLRSDVGTIGDSVFFPETNQRVGGAFLGYWRSRGGLARFGYPLTAERGEVSPTDGKAYTVQYFERARFELHPELRGTPFEVELGLLGRQVTRDRTFVEVPAFSSLPDRVYFPETGHTLASGFLTYWRQNGGLEQFGYPLSEEISEAGRTVQYLERARFEYFPEWRGTAYEVQLGHLGREVTRAGAGVP